MPYENINLINREYSTAIKALQEYNDKFPIDNKDGIGMKLLQTIQSPHLVYSLDEKISLSQYIGQYLEDMLHVLDSDVVLDLKDVPVRARNILKKHKITTYAELARYAVRKDSSGYWLIGVGKADDRISVGSKTLDDLKTLLAKVDMKFRDNPL